MSRFDHLRHLVSERFEKLEGRMSASDVEHWLKSPGGVDAVLGTFVRASPEIGDGLMKPWMSVSVGTRPRGEIVEALEDQWIISGGTKQLLTVPEFNISAPSLVRYVLISPEEFGFTERPHSDEFLNDEFLSLWSRQHLRGQAVELCLPGDALELGMAGVDLSRSSVLWVGMKPLLLFGVNSILYFDDTIGRTRIEHTSPDRKWRLGDLIIFRLRDLEAKLLA